MNIRCFVAVNLPDNVRRLMGTIIAELKKAGADVKWVDARNIHLTLKFLGNTNAALIPAIIDALGKKLSLYKPFYITIAGVGCFPSEKRPRVIWIGMEDSEILKELQQDIDLVLSSFGFAPDDRPFSPHFTIGRVKSMQKIRELMYSFEDLRKTEFGSIEVSSIHVVKSELRPAGAEYRSLGRILLGHREE